MELKLLFEQCKRGDPKAQEAFYRLLGRKMFRTCQRYVDDDRDIPDILSKSFLNALLAIPKVNYISEAATMAWIKSIVVNECLMYKRYLKVVVCLPAKYIPDQPIPNDAFSGVTEKELLGYIRELPFIQRFVFNLFVFENMCHKDIGDYLDIPEVTSRSHLNRARRSLQATILKNHKEYAYRKK